MDTLIKYAGSVYAIAPVKHKKCAVGTHWNSSKRKCMKLGPELSRARRTANSFSLRAHSNSQKARSTPRKHPSYSKAHGNAGVSHSKAAFVHEQLAHRLRKNGFHKLADKHLQIAQKHSLKGNRHFIRHTTSAKSKRK